jgi:pimeloyl-ACP methyl ester carboxylesterase
MFGVRLRTALLGLGALIGLAWGMASAMASNDDAIGTRTRVPGTNGWPVELYSEERGRGDPIVLLHGLGGSTYSWRYIAPVLARSQRVIAIDLKGFGRSDKAFDTDYAAADQAHLIAGFLRGRGLTNVTLVGHSFGGVVALLTTMEMKRRDPGRVRKLVLIDAPALPQELTPVVRLMQQPVLPYALLTVIPAGVMTSLAMLPSPGERLARAYTAEDASAYAAPFYDAAARHAYIQTSRQIAPALSLRDLVAAYRRVTQRTLLVWCTNDRVVPLSTGKALASILPRARLEQLDGCNHTPTDEAPAALAQAIARFTSP